VLTVGLALSTCPSATLMHSARAVEQNEMPFDIWQYIVILTEQLAQSCYLIANWPGVELMTFW